MNQLSGCKCGSWSDVFVIVSAVLTLVWCKSCIHLCTWCIDTCEDLRLYLVLSLDHINPMRRQNYSQITVAQEGCMTWYVWKEWRWRTFVLVYCTCRLTPEQISPSRVDERQHDSEDASKLFWSIVWPSHCFVGDRRLSSIALCWDAFTALQKTCCKTLCYRWLLSTSVSSIW